MKLVDEKGKLFGFINVVDLVCILLVLLVVVGVVWKAAWPAVSEAVSPTVPMTTVLRVRGTQEYFQKELDRVELVGQKLVMGTDYVDAVVTEVYTEPYKTQAITDEGIIVDAVDPTKVDYMIVVQSSVAKDTPIIKIGSQEVRAGRTFTFKTRTIEVVTYVDSIVLGE